MADILDLKEFMERVQDDKELLLELLDIYQEDFVKKRHALTEAVNGKDAQKVREIAHSLKGASGNISAKPLHANFIIMEQSAKNNDLSQTAGMLTEIDKQFEDLKENIVRIKKDFSG